MDLSQLGVVTVNSITSQPTVSVAAIEDQSLALNPIVVFDVDAQPTYNPAGPLTQYDPTLAGWNGYDPDWHGRVTLTAVHGTLSLDTRVVPQDLTSQWATLNDAAINGTAFGDPSTSLAPMGGEGGSRDEAGLMGVVDATTGTSTSGLVTISDPGMPDDRKWAHTAGVSDFTKWLVQDASGQAGLLISLPGDFTIDVLQLWNFNANGLEQYGIDQFKIYTAPAGALPTTLAGWTPVLLDNPGTGGIDESLIQVPKASGANYLGETYVFGGADASQVVPAGLGDANSGVTSRNEKVSGQYIFLQLKNTSPGAAYVGLSELKLLGRPTAAADVTFVTGDGIADKTMTLEGSLLALNTVLSKVTYQSDLNYNSGTPTPVADQVTVTIEDHWTGNPQQYTGTGTAANSFQGTIQVVVVPTQDDPSVTATPGSTQVTLNEDVPTTLTGLGIADPDAQYDAGWIGQLVLSVNNGTLSLPSQFTTREIYGPQQLNIHVTQVLGKTADGTLQVAADTNAAGQSRDASHLLDGSGLSLSTSGPTAGKLVHSADETAGANSWTISAETGGLLIDFGDQYNLQAMQLWNLNVAGQLAQGAGQLDIYAWDKLPAGQSALDDSAHKVNAAALTLDPGTGLPDYLGQTFRFGGFLNQPTELGGTVTDVPQALTGRYVFLKLADTDLAQHVGLSELKFYGGPAVAAGKIAAVTATDGAGGSVVTPEPGTAGDARDVRRLFDGSGLSLNASGQLIHGTSESLGAIGWSIAQDNGGIRIDLGAVYTIDVMQIWNFNTTGALGADLTGYGATQFDLWASNDSFATMTQVLSAVPLTLAPYNDPNYLGETYLLSGKLDTSIPAELGDQGGKATNLADKTVTGRYLFIGGLKTSVAGADPQPGHLGLSEIRVYGRPQGAPDLTYLIGDGRGGDSQLRVQGSFADLNAVLSNLVYTPSPDYNNANKVPANPAVLNITVIDADSVAVPVSGGGGGGPGPVTSPGPVTITRVTPPTTANANALRDALLGAGVTAVGNAILVGGATSSGLFLGGSDSLGIPSGIVLSSGNVNLVAGPNTSDGSTGQASMGGDADLDAEFNVITEDTTYLQFDFQLAPGGAQDLYFNFVFASEEYNEFANTMFNDVFAFFVDGQNIAFIPGTTTPISINTINGGGPIYGTSPKNPQYYNNNDVSNGGGFLPLFGMDGFTSVFTAQALGIGPGVHTIKLAIADVGDFSLDSAVFLAAGSFSNVLPGWGNGKNSSDWNNVPSNAATNNPNVPAIWTGAVTLTVNPIQDAPRIDLSQIGAVTVDPYQGTTTVSASGTEDQSLTLPPIVIYDVDAQPTYNPAGPLSQYDPTVAGWSGYDPNWQGQVTLTAANGTLSLPAGARPTLIPLGAGDLLVNGTNANGTASIAPENGEGGNRDEDSLGSGDVVTGTVVNSHGLSLNAAGQLVHSNGLNDSTKWSIAQQNGGLMIDLQQVYTIDVMQLWNFNVAALYDYGPLSFDLWVSSGSTLPVGTSGMTKLLTATPLAPASATADAAGYLGETYLFSGAASQVIPSELGDANGVDNYSGTTITGRYLFFGNLTGTAAAGGHVGLSEIRLYGRPAGSPNVVYSVGDGVNDPTITITGSLASLNAALSGVVYTPKADYNSGNPTAGNVVPDSILVQVSDLGNTQPGAPLTAQATIAVTVAPKQDTPTIPVVPTVPATAVIEDQQYILPQIGVFDVDARQSVVSTVTQPWATVTRDLDPLWRAEVSLSVNHGTLSLSDDMITKALPRDTGVTVDAASRQADGTTLAAGATDRAAINAVNGNGLTTVPVAGVNKLIHQTTDVSTAWSLSQQSGGLMIDLGAVYRLDVLQIWNFNVAGLEGYGPTSFDLWVSAGASLPGDTTSMTHVLTSESLAQAVPGDVNYLGETYLFSGATLQVLPGELGDETNGPTDLSANTVVARYLFLGNLQGTLDLAGVGHVGLAEVKAYGRPVTSPDLVFTQGNGRGGDRTLAFQGSVDALNQVLNGQVRYQPDPNYNSGDPANDATSGTTPITGYHVTPDVLTVTINDLRNTDISAIATSRTNQVTIPIPVNPEQDAPVILSKPLDQVIDEDAAAISLPLSVYDVDARSTFAQAGASTYDPDWVGKITLTVQHGTLTVPTGTGLTFQPVGANSGSSVVFAGGLDALNNALASLQYKVDANFNSGDPALLADRDVLNVTFDDLGSTENLADVSPDVGPLTATTQVTISVRPINDAPAITVPPNLATTVVEDTSTGLLLVDGSNVGIRVNDADQVYDPSLLQLQVTVSVLHGGVTMDVTGLGLTPVVGQTILASVDGLQPATPGTYQQLTYRGTLADLNSALATMKYYGDLHFNTGVQNDVLTIAVNDMGNTDKATLNHVSTNPADAKALTATKSVTLTVTPQQDTPTLPTVPTVPIRTVVEDTPYSLPLIQVFDVDARSTLAKNGSTLYYDPSWLGQVTLSVAHGSITLNNTNGVTFQTGFANATRTVTFRGTLDALNAVLAAGNVTYLSDPNYNSGDPANDPAYGGTATGTFVVTPDVLTITLDDLGYSDTTIVPGTPGRLGQTAVATVPIQVNPKQDAPQITIRPVVPTNAVMEDAPYALPQTQIFDVDQRSNVDKAAPGLLTYDPDWIGQVTLSALHGTLTVTNTTGLTFQSGGNNGGHTVIFRGTLDDLNTALLAGNVVYLSDSNYNSGDTGIPSPADPIVPDVLTITFDDLKSTDLVAGTASTPVSTQVSIQVNPKQDQPTIPTLPTVPIKTVIEDTPYKLAAIQVFDVDARSSLTKTGSTLYYDPDWVGQVTLIVQHGTLRLASTSPLILNSVFGDGTNTVIFEGSLDALNAALNGVTYQSDKDYNSGDPANDPLYGGTTTAGYLVTPDVLSISFDDLLNTDVSLAGLGPATGTISIQVNPKQDAPTIPVLPTVPTTAVLEDTSYTLPTVQVFDVDARSTLTSAGAATYDPDWIGQVTLSALHGNLTLNNIGNIAFQSGGANATHTVIFRGSLDALNAALTGISYQGDPNYNSGDPADGSGSVTPDLITVTFDDLKNTDLTVTQLTPATAQLSVQVNPKQDSPVWQSLPTVPTDAVLEDTPYRVSGIGVFDVDARSTWAQAGALTYDANWVGQLTLSALHGTLTLSGITGLTFQTGGANGTHTVIFQGGLDALNAALGAVTYQGDKDYNSGDPADGAGSVTPDVLTITFDDLGNTDIAIAPGTPGRAGQTVVSTVPIQVNPKQDAPTILSLPTVPKTDVLEDAAYTLPTIQVFDVDARSTLLATGALNYDANWVGQITLSVQHGTLTVATGAGVTFLPTGANTGSSVVFTGGLDALNAALSGVTYLSAANYNSGDPSNDAVTGTIKVPGYHVTPDQLSITFDDLKNTDIVGGATTTPATAQMPIQVNPKQDSPTVPTVPTVPTSAVLEDTRYTLPAIQVFDVDARSTLATAGALTYDPDWLGQITLSVQHGAITVATVTGVTFQPMGPTAAAPWSSGAVSTP